MDTEWLDRFDSMLSGANLAQHSVPGDDVVVPMDMYEVNFNESWIIVDADVFRSWTGLRRFHGVEVHGPIYSFGDKAQVKPYTGKRTCGCPKCQEHVEPQFRPN